MIADRRRHLPSAMIPEPRTYALVRIAASAMLAVMGAFAGFAAFPHSSTALAQTLSGRYSPALADASPTSVGMSEERLARIDAMLERAIGERQIPGAVALIARDGQIIYHKAFGDAFGKAFSDEGADGETGGTQSGNPSATPPSRAYRTDDIFRIASMTKAITSTAVMMLWEEGRFRLDDPVSAYIPELAELSVLDAYNAADTTFTTRAAGKPVTIRHLLTHTSGISYANIGRDPRLMTLYRKAGVIDLVADGEVTIADNVSILADLPLLHEPGAEFTYGLNTDILGHLVQVVSGLPLDEFLRRRILDPLGMEDTWFYLPEPLHARLVPVLVPSEEGWTLLEKTISGDPDYPLNTSGTYFSGGGGLSSTARDYATFLQMMLNQGELNGIRLLSRTTVDMMMRNHIGEIWNGQDSHLGLAFGVINERGEQMGGKGSSGTFEWGGYFNTQYFADPNEGIIGVLMKQTLNQRGDETAWRFRQMVFSAIDD